MATLGHVNGKAVIAADSPSHAGILGLVLEQREDFEGAAQQYALLGNDEPEGGEAWFRLGFARLHSNDLEGAGPPLATLATWEPRRLSPITTSRWRIGGRAVSARPPNVFALLSKCSSGSDQACVVLPQPRSLRATIPSHANCTWIWWSAATLPSKSPSILRYWSTEPIVSIPPSNSINKRSRSIPILQTPRPASPWRRAHCPPGVPNEDSHIQQRQSVD